MTTEQANQLSSLYNKYVTGDEFSPIRGTISGKATNDVNNPYTFTVGFKAKAVVFKWVHSDFMGLIHYNYSYNTTKYDVALALNNSAASGVGNSTGTLGSIIGCGSNSAYKFYLNITNTAVVFASGYANPSYTISYIIGK